MRGAFVCARVVWRRERDSSPTNGRRAVPLRCQRGGVPGGALVVAWGGMGGTWPRSNIDPASGFLQRNGGKSGPGPNGRLGVSMGGIGVIRKSRPLHIFCANP